MDTRSKLTVNLNLLQDNFLKLKKLCPDNKIIFMVKANGYGHGLLPIAKFANRELGVNEFGCASLSEAKLLCSQIVDNNVYAYVFSYNSLNEKSSHSIYKKYNIIPVIHSLECLKNFLNYSIFYTKPLIVKFNTGMNRLGIHYSDTKEVIKILKNYNRTSIEHLMTHLASAFCEDIGEHKTRHQLKIFEEIRACFDDSGIFIKDSSVANSAAIERGWGIEHSYIRPGLMLYGPSAFNVPKIWGGKIISKWATVVLKTSTIDKNSEVGYGSYLVSKRGNLVIIPIGYGDGLSTGFGGAKIAIGKNIGELVGQISMDTSQAIFEQNSSINEGDEVIIWDSNPNRLENLRRHIGIITYELFCRISPRITREYLYNGIDYK